MPDVFRHRLRVRYGECDVQGVVFNANYLAYFDVVFTEFWREAIGDYNATTIDVGADMMVAESRIRFVGSAAFDEQLDFELRIGRLGNTAVTTQLAAHVGERPVLEGEMRYVCIDPKTKEKRPLPQHIRAGMQPYLIEEPERAAAAGS